MPATKEVSRVAKIIHQTMPGGQKEGREKARGRLCADFLRKGRDAAFALRTGQLLQRSDSAQS